MFARGRITFLVAWFGANGILFPTAAAAGSGWSDRQWAEHCSLVRTSHNPDERLNRESLTLGIYDPRWEDFVLWVIINGIGNRVVVGPVAADRFSLRGKGGIELRWAGGTRWEHQLKYSYGYAVALLVGEHGWRDVQFAGYFSQLGGTYDYNLKDRLYLEGADSAEPWDRFFSLLGDRQGKHFSYALAQPVFADLEKEKVIYTGGQGVAYEVSYPRFLADLKEFLSDCRVHEFFEAYDFYGQGFASRPGWSGTQVSAGARRVYTMEGGKTGEDLLPVTVSDGSQAASPAGDNTMGESIYHQQCAVCHGNRGGGKGIMSASMKPAPRDLTSGIFKLRSTPSGSLPRDRDLLRVIATGVPGTAMPGWSQFLSDEEIKAVSSYVKSLSNRFSRETAPEPVPVGPARFPTGEGLLSGAKTWLRLGCPSCHGKDGHGDGPRALELRDAWGEIILPSDLSDKWQFRGGATPEAIYQRLVTGMDGTPMQSYLGQATESDLWNLVFYLLDFSPQQRKLVHRRATDTPP